MSQFSPGRLLLYSALSISMAFVSLVVGVLVTSPEVVELLRVMGSGELQPDSAVMDPIIRMLTVKMPIPFSLSLIFLLAGSVTLIASLVSLLKIISRRGG